MSAVIVVIIAVVRRIILIGISVREGVAAVPEMISVPRKVRSLVFCEALAGKPSKMTACPAEASTMPTTTMAAASSTMCERGGGRERQNAGHNQTDQ